MACAPDVETRRTPTPAMKGFPHKRLRWQRIQRAHQNSQRNWRARQNCQRFWRARGRRRLVARVRQACTGGTRALRRRAREIAQPGRAAGEKALCSLARGRTRCA
eukprot:6190884-Pleurochrysis_carterae.AAC.2